MQILVCVSTEKIPDFISWQIMRRLRYAGSHIFIVYQGRMYHSVERGVCHDDFTAFSADHHITHQKEVSLNCTEEEFFAWFEKHQGIQYSNAQYFGFFFGFLKRFVRNYRKKAICSEFVAWVLTDLAGRIEFKDADFLSPKDVFELI